MAGWIKKVKAFQFKGILVILGCFLLIGAILFAERSGLSYREKAKKLTYLDADKVVTEETAIKTLKPTCIVLTDSSQANSTMAWIQFEQIFKDMKVGTDLVDVNHESIPDDLSDYETVVVLLSDLSPLKENVLKIRDWVKEGGSAMFALTLQKDTYVSLIEQKLGIVSSGYTDAMVNSIYFDSEFLVGGGKAYKVTDGYESAWAVELSQRARVYAWADDTSGVPLIWEADYGNGKFVVDNFGFYEKAFRGFFAASYSLLTDVGVYPANRYWYRNLQYWCHNPFLHKFHLHLEQGRENYEDETDGETERQDDVQRFQYFGNMILHQGVPSLRLFHPHNFLL